MKLLKVTVCTDEYFFLIKVTGRTPWNKIIERIHRDDVGNEDVRPSIQRYIEGIPEAIFNVLEFPSEQQGIKFEWVERFLPSWE